MDSVAVFAGQTITVGAVASFLAQYIKGREWFPVRFKTLIIRLMVAAICLAINATVVCVLVVVEASCSANVLVTAFFSYIVAAAAYDQLFS